MSCYTVVLFVFMAWAALVSPHSASEAVQQKSFMEEFDEQSGGGFVRSTTRVEILGDGSERTTKRTEKHHKNAAAVNGSQDVDVETSETYRYLNGTVMQIKRHGSEEKVIENVNCTEDEHCATGSFCNGLQYSCVHCLDANTTCNRDAQCCAGATCNNGTCQSYEGESDDLCQSNSDCPPRHCCVSDFGSTFCKLRPRLGDSCGYSRIMGFPIFDMFKSDHALPSYCECEAGLKCQTDRPNAFFASKTCSPLKPLKHRRRNHGKAKRSSPFPSPPEFLHRPSFLDTIGDFLDNIFGQNDN